MYDRSVTDADPTQHAMAIAVYDPTPAHRAVAALAIGAVVGAIAVGTVISPARTGGETERKAGAKAQADATPARTAAAPMTAMAAVTAPPGIRGAIAAAVTTVFLSAARIISSQFLQKIIAPQKSIPLDRRRRWHEAFGQHSAHQPLIRRLV